MDGSERAEGLVSRTARPEEPHHRRGAGQALLRAHPPVAADARELPEGGRAAPLDGARHRGGLEDRAGAPAGGPPGWGGRGGGGAGRTAGAPRGVARPPRALRRGRAAPPALPPRRWTAF